MYKSYQLSVITDAGIITTPHYGVDDEITDIIEELWGRIAAVENKDDLRKAFAEFTQNNGQKNADADKVGIFTHALPVADELCYSIEGEWYADFTVIRNITDRDFDITALNGKHSAICLCSDESVVLNLGEFYAGSDDDIARRKLIAELEDLKENLWDDNADKNYSALWNLCADYDNTQRDNLYLTDIISEAEFVDDELVDQYFKSILETNASLARIRHFIGDTRDDYIYKLDGYGNLANVDKDDFIEVIDNVQDKLIDTIEPEKPYAPQGGSGKRGAAHAGGAAM